METKRNPRNGLVDVMRLEFAGVVVMYHFYSNGEKHFPNGYLGVEFFAILAGFLMFSAWDHKHIASLPLKERKNYWLNYMRRRYTRFFWYCLVAFVLTFFVVRILQDEFSGITDISNALSEDIWEILLIN